MSGKNDVPAVPLIVDLDGTLTRTDTTYELLILFLKKFPLTGWLRVLLWRKRGLAEMKAQLVAHVGERFDETTLPYTTALLESPVYAEAEHRVLVSGAQRDVVENVAKHVGDFESFVGTDEGRNLTSRTKADYLIATYPVGFDYIGNSSEDLSVWKKARKSYAVNATSSVLEKAKSENISLEVLVPRFPQRASFIKEMRLHQWAKNTLLFVVPALNLAALTPLAILGLLGIFVAFGLVASATYVLNDLLDLQEDRKHHSKSKRPLAAGVLDVKNGIIGTVGLFVIGMALALLINPGVSLLILIYAAVSLSYSLYFKRLVILDAIVLAFLFCWRILVGGVVIGQSANEWFMTAVGAFFLSLAFGKRCIELERRRTIDAKGPDVQMLGRGYVGRDLPVVMSLGIVSGLIAPVIVLIYVFLSGSSIVNHITSASALAVLLCYWISRFWILVNRGAVHDDPIIFALKDKVSFMLLVAMAFILVVEQAT